MPDIPLRNRALRRLSTMTAAVAVVLGLVVLIGTVLTPDSALMPGFAAGVVLVALSLILHIAVLVALKAEANINRTYHAALDMLDELRKMQSTLRAMADSSQISDAVRSITHRESEREALRQAIREEMYGGDWEAAAYLIDEMERRFGYKQEAESLREELSKAREMTIEEKITQAVSHITKVMDDLRWERARMEIERIIKLFPRHESVLALPRELARRRETRKQELLAKWKQAVEREEIDTGIQILTELDPYLAPEEAQHLQDSARHVFKARLLNLGVQFGLAVSEHRWRDALEIGIEIRQEFPNSRMAQEVSERLDTLRGRAGFKTDAEVVLRPRQTTASEPV